MSKSSIYEASWTNLVFENKNKEYGAYQLRQENSKTTITALFMALLLLAALGSASMLINKFGSDSPVDNTVPQIIDEPVIVTVDPLVQPKIEEPVAPPAPKSAPAAVTTSAQLVNPVVTRTQDAVEDIAVNTDNVPVVENTTGTGTAVNTMPTTSGGDGVLPVTDPGTTVLPVTSLDKLPEFPGGMAKFYTYVGNNFNRPELDAERTLRVYVSFVIERDGSITDIMVKNDPGYGIGKEAIRVLKSLKTKWIPGVLNGKAVRTAYNLPITIKTEAE